MNSNAAEQAKSKIINNLIADPNFRSKAPDPQRGGQIGLTATPLIDDVRIKRTVKLTSDSSYKIKFDKNAVKNFPSDTTLLQAEFFVPYGANIYVHKLDADGSIVPGKNYFTFPDLNEFGAAGAAALEHVFSGVFGMTSSRQQVWTGRPMDKFRIVPQQQQEDGVLHESNGCRSCCPIQNDFGFKGDDENVFSFNLPSGAVAEFTADPEVCYAVTIELCAQLYRGTTATGVCTVTV